MFLVKKQQFVWKLICFSLLVEDSTILLETCLFWLNINLFDLNLKYFLG